MDLFFECGDPGTALLPGDLAPLVFIFPPLLSGTKKPPYRASQVSPTHSGAGVTALESRVNLDMMKNALKDFHGFQYPAHLRHLVGAEEAGLAEEGQDGKKRFRRSDLFLKTGESMG